MVAELEARGIRAVSAVWDDPAVDWDAFELVVLRSTWDYAERRDEFLAWVGRLPRVLNEPAVVRWNTDKRYLADLAAAGVRSCRRPFSSRTTHSASGRAASSSSRRCRPAAGRARRARADELALAGEHVARLHAEDRP